MGENAEIGEVTHSKGASTQGYFNGINLSYFEVKGARTRAPFLVNLYANLYVNKLLLELILPELANTTTFLDNRSPYEALSIR